MPGAQTSKWTNDNDGDNACCSVSSGHCIGGRLFWQHKGYQSAWRRQLAVYHQLPCRLGFFDQHRRNCDTCRRRQFWYTVQKSVVALLWKHNRLLNIDCSGIVVHRPRSVENEARCLMRLNSCQSLITKTRSCVKLAQQRESNCKLRLTVLWQAMSDINLTLVCIAQ